MKANKTIAAFHIKNKSYLLPFGQGIADHVCGIEINSLGKQLWDLICSGATREELLAFLAKSYEADPGDLPLLKEDLSSFITQLANNRFFDLPGEPPTPFAEKKLRLGPIAFSLRGPESLYETYFTAFSDQFEEAALTVSVYPYYPVSHPNGSVLVRNEEIIILETENQYIFLPLRGRYVAEMRCTKNGNAASIYCSFEESGECLEELFHAIRFPFLVAAQAHDLCVIHSASILYQEKAWLFSGPSGAGKSTHINLWQSQFQAPILNGDLNMLGIQSGQAVCYGLPWCGTSGLCTAKAHPLGGIVFLKQAPYDKVSTLSGDRELLCIFQRLITPTWTLEQTAKNLRLADRLCEKIDIFQLECTKNPQAVYAIKKAMDGLS